MKLDVKTLSNDELKKLAEDVRDELMNRREKRLREEQARGKAYGR